MRPGTQTAHRSALGLPYLLALPHAWAPAEDGAAGTWPLLVYLHGAGESGTDLGIGGHGARVASVEVHEVHSSPLSVRDVVVGDGAVEPERRAHAARHLRRRRTREGP